jgi:hypothetical protein
VRAQIIIQRVDSLAFIIDDFTTLRQIFDTLPIALLFCEYKKEEGK